MMEIISYNYGEKKSIEFYGQAVETKNDRYMLITNVQQGKEILDFLSTEEEFEHFDIFNDESNNIETYSNYEYFYENGTKENSNYVIIIFWNE